MTKLFLALLPLLAFAATIPAAETPLTAHPGYGIAQEPGSPGMPGGPALAAAPRPEEDGLVAPAGMPPFGKWMYTSLLKRANWLGVPYKGKTLYEPVNIIIVDAYAKNTKEALARLLTAAHKAGFPARWGHSTGYQAFIADAFTTQVKGKKHHAFSDAAWSKANNHGRIFGPVLFDGKYWFAAAFSRQSVSLLRKVRHRYVSFNEARDKFALAMNNATAYKVSRLIEMENALTGPGMESAGDHDGLAVFLETVETP